MTAEGADSSGQEEEDEEEASSPLDEAIATLEDTVAALSATDGNGVNGFAREFFVLDREDHESVATVVVGDGLLGWLVGCLLGVAWCCLVVLV